MSEAKHTPLPWALEYRAGRETPAGHYVPDDCEAYDLAQATIVAPSIQTGGKRFNVSTKKWDSLPITHFEVRLDEINREINAIPYVSDAATYREASFWQTPIQFAQSGGECRDYVVAKYSALYATGVADSDMLFAAVRVRSGKYAGQLHAVLLVKHGGRTYVLDNLYPNVRPASAMADYEPVYFINRLGMRVVHE